MSEASPSVGLFSPREMISPTRFALKTCFSGQGNLSNSSISPVGGRPVTAKFKFLKEHLRWKAPYVRISSLSGKLETQPMTPLSFS